MKAFIKIPFIFMLLFCSTVLLAQDAEVLNCRFNRLFVMGDMESWAQLVDSLEQSELSVHDDEVLLYAQYGLIAHLIGEDCDDEASKRLESYEKHVDRLIAKAKNDPNLLTLDATVLGFSMGISPWRASYLAARHQSKINDALERRSNQFLPLIEKAHLLYFMPSFLGGDREKAVGMYQEAMVLIDRQSTCNWMYYHLGAWLGQVHAKMENKKEARLVYEHLLEREPEFKKVKNELLPQLDAGSHATEADQFEKILN